MGRFSTCGRVRRQRHIRWQVSYSPCSLLLIRTATGLPNSCLLASLEVVLLYFIVFSYRICNEYAFSFELLVIVFCNKCSYFNFCVYHILLCRYDGGASPGGGDRPGGKRDLPTIDEDEDEAWTAPVPKRYSTDKEYGIPL